MLKKEKTLPGAMIQIRPVIKDGVPANYGGGNTLPYISLMLEPGGSAIFTGIAPAQIHSGETIEVLVGPKKYHGINCVKVRRGTDEGYIYWCEARASADHI